MRFDCLVSTLSIAVLYMTFKSVVSSCSDIWFGEFCQYKCHCQNKACLSDGSCNVTSCESGWFGLKCQYSNVMQHQSTWILDEDDSTCNTDPNLKEVSLKLTDERIFTWLRLTFKEKEPIREISLLFNTATPCVNQKLSLVDNKTLDVWCTLNVTIQQIDIIGEGVKCLCSVYVSGGRNVALKQPTMQTSIYFFDFPPPLASNAVDGNTDGDFEHGSCTHTGEMDPSPTWTVKFNNTFIINRFVIYNRNKSAYSGGEDYRLRLNNFILTVFGANNSTLLNYTDSNITPHSIYTINRFIKEIVGKVSITASMKYHYFPILTLCEVEIFGDCPEGNNGLDCQQTCNEENNFCNSVCLGYNDPPACANNCSAGMWGINCANNCSKQCWDSNCDRTSGLCLSGCLGYNDPPYCIQSCSYNQWGLNCSHTCSINCRNSSCDRLTGHCMYGCLPGFTGPNCSIECESGKWGLNCNQQCNTRCFDSSCHKADGLCIKGCNGFSDPPNCKEGCETGLYGTNCLFNCSKNCENNNCTAENGKCLNCVSGFHGVHCDIEKQPSKISVLPPEAFLGIGIGIGVFISVLVFVFVWLLCLRRRYTIKQASTKNETAQNVNYYDSLQFESTPNSTYELSQT